MAILAVVCGVLLRRSRTGAERLVWASITPRPCPLAFAVEQGRPSCYRTVTRTTCAWLNVPVAVLCADTTRSYVAGGSVAIRP